MSHRGSHEDITPDPYAAPGTESGGGGMLLPSERRKAGEDRRASIAETRESDDGDHPDDTAAVSDETDAESGQSDVALEFDDLLVQECIELRPLFHSSDLRTNIVFTDIEGRALAVARRESHFARRILAIIGAILVFLASFIPLSVILSMLIQSRPGVGVVVFFLGLLLAGLLAVAAGMGMYPKRHVHITEPHKPYEVRVSLIPESTFRSNSSYIIADPDLNLLGWLTRSSRGMASLWNCYNAEGVQVLAVAEDMPWLGIFRLLSAMTIGATLFPQNFVWNDPDTGRPVARLDRRSEPGRRHVLEFFDEPDVADDPESAAGRIPGGADRRLAISLVTMIEMTSW